MSKLEMALSGISSVSHELALVARELVRGDSEAVRLECGCHKLPSASNLSRGNMRQMMNVLLRPHHER